ncbi:hypothetical protein ACFFIF_01305 [Vagococcus entomophilus]|uniref:hypothetical protein n=1 Tax=Vagococcus entomophilus TaxID=1160095 RepID=UPI0011D13FBC|nr:hypothetical protein [Vagococcus entomophilus]
MKLGYYKNNVARKKRIQFVNTVVIGITPVAAYLLFIFNMLTNVGIGSLFLVSIAVLVGYMTTSLSAHFYMVYYLRKRFPEDFVKEDQMEEE